MKRFEVGDAWRLLRYLGVACAIYIVGHVVPDAFRERWHPVGWFEATANNIEAVGILLVVALINWVNTMNEKAPS